MHWELIVVLVVVVSWNETSVAAKSSLHVYIEISMGSGFFLVVEMISVVDKGTWTVVVLGKQVAGPPFQ